MGEFKDNLKGVYRRIEGELKGELKGDVWEIEEGSKGNWRGN